jgi:hypothetical protein
MVISTPIWRNTRVTKKLFLALFRYGYNVSHLYYAWWGFLWADRPTTGPVGLSAFGYCTVNLPNTVDSFSSFVLVIHVNERDIIQCWPSLLYFEFCCILFDLYAYNLSLISSLCFEQQTDSIKLYFLLLQNIFIKSTILIRKAMPIIWKWQ